MRLVVLGSSLVVLAGLLSSCSDGGGSSAIVVAPPGQIVFGQASFMADENGPPTQSITVSRIGGSAGLVSVDVLLQDGTATGGTAPLQVPADFVAGSTTVTFADGDQTQKTITIVLLDDDIVEGPETIQVSLANVVGGAEIGPLSQAILTIGDDDAAGSISFSSATFSYGENGAPVVAITVERTGGVDGIVGATITSVDGTANSDAASFNERQDFAALSTTVGFADQDATPQVIVLNGIVSDVLPEINESFTIDLSSPTGGALIGSIGSATVTIVDDDVLLTINNPTPAASEKFGSSAVKSRNMILVGSPDETVMAQTSVGAVYRFNPTTGAQIGGALTRPFGNANDRFGSPLLALGTDVAIGATNANFSAGLVLIFDPTNGALKQQIFGGTCVGANALFGISLAGVGANLLIASPGAGTQNGNFCVGGGMVFGVNPLTTITFVSLLPPNGSSAVDGFGTALTVGGGHIVVGAPLSNSPVLGGLVEVYDDTTFALELMLVNPFPSQVDRFGEAVAVFNGQIIVGAPEDDTSGTDTGTVYVFDATTGSLVQQIAPPTTVAGGRFGAELAVVRDRLCIQHKNAGASMSGQVVVYDAGFNVVQTIANPTPTTSANFGASLDEFDGALIIGCPLHDVGAVMDAGIAYVSKLN